MQGPVERGKDEQGHGEQQEMERGYRRGSQHLPCEEGCVVLGFENSLAYGSCSPQVCLPIVPRDPQTPLKSGVDKGTSATTLLGTALCVAVCSAWRLPR
jgi:hypothetical protein